MGRGQNTCCILRSPLRPVNSCRPEKTPSELFPALLTKAAAADAVLQGCAEQPTGITEPIWLPLST